MTHIDASRIREYGGCIDNLASLHLTIGISGDTGCGAFSIILEGRSLANVRNWLLDGFYFDIVLGGLSRIYPP